MSSTAAFTRSGTERSSRRGHWLAAVLAAGPDAVLSHPRAAALWGLRDDNRTRIDITTPRVLRPRKNLLPHCAVLPPDETTIHDAIPTTTAPRTLLDLAREALPKLQDHLPIITRKELEHRFHAFVAAAGLPRPRFNPHIVQELKALLNR